jgi:amylosucrase
MSQPYPQIDVLLESKLTWNRLLPDVKRAFHDRYPEESSSEIGKDWMTFEGRLKHAWESVFALLFELYGHRYDFTWHLQKILIATALASAERSTPLRALDRRRECDPDWFMSHKMVGGALYVDLFSENLGKLRDQIPYFKQLGLTYLHLMPLFAVRPGDNDGGYAISNYRSVDPRLGTVEDLKLLAGDLREAGISLVLDFVFNHTADDHYWATQAQAGDPEYQQFYYLFPDRSMPDAYERTLREIFPTVRKGSFTWHAGMQRWVWTTFNSFQWDLNYANPAVFRAMLEEMLFLANTGVEILRLDAVAFIWKEMGTGCENLPKAHSLIRAFNALGSMVSPGLLFKSEAIVHPDEVVRYISPAECQLSYNPTLMALLWESMATREVKLLEATLHHRHKLPAHCAWCNYLRCHDDIGWTFDDEDAAKLGINGYGHRKFLNDFYTGQFEGSFARGVPFQHNVETGDMRISGTLASLAGLELAVEANNEAWKEMALRRIIMLHAVLCSAGGIPLLYLGEEWGMLNDYSFVKDPAKMADSRWIHRPKMKWEYLEDLKGEVTIHRRIFTAIQKIITLRKELRALSGLQMKLFATENPHVLGYIRSFEGLHLMVLASFADSTQVISGNRVRTAGMGRHFKDHLSGKTLSTGEPLLLEPYQVLWLESV